MQLSARVVALVFLVACAPVPADDEAWFSGPVHTTSPDGTQDYGTATSFVHRERFPAEHRIVETVSQSSDTFVTTLVSEDDVTFDGSDDADSFSGVLVFSGSPWEATSAWSYDLVMSDGSGSLVGAGALDASGIHTAKQFLDPDGVDVAHLTDELAPLDEATYAVGIAD